MDKKKKIGLIGHPISHSKSPALFYERFKNDKSIIDNYCYELIENENFDEAINIFKSDFIAVNVTSPFKEMAFSIADRYEGECNYIGATNLLIKSKGEIIAHNTDCIAIQTLIDTISKNSDKKLNSSVIIGCGGGGKAAIIASLDRGIKTSIINRSVEKCTLFINRLENFGYTNIGLLDNIYPTDGVKGGIENEIKRADLIIYTLPLQIEELPIDLFRDKTIIEANYLNPTFKKREIESLKIRYIGGEQWLKIQADATYDLIYKTNPSGRCE